MTFVRSALFFLSLLILRRISSEQPEPVFRAKDNNIEMGYCFGADYVVVYRSTSEGDRLLGNSSDRNTTDAAHAGLEGRTRIIEDHDLLGLQIVNLTRVDSGIYRRECWVNQTRLSHHALQLTVCSEEVRSEEISKKEGGGAELLCNSTFARQEGISVRWYREIYENFKVALFFDSGVSLKPSVEDLPGVVEVKDRGALLVVDGSVLKSHQQFYCVVVNGTDCLSFQNMYTPDSSDSREIFASQGDEVVLYCPADGHNQQWDTPLGKIDDGGGGSGDTSRMYVSPKPGNFSLVIPAVSDEHGGDYLCFSSTLDIQYWLGLCSTKQHQEEVAHEGGAVSLECGSDQNASLCIQWHRRKLSGQDELLYDSRDETMAVPAELGDRLSLSDGGSLLTISDLRVTDGGAYWCVLLSGQRSVEGDGDYPYDYEEETDYEDEDYSPHTQNCLSKQVTRLTVATSSGVVSDGSTNVVAYAVGGGLVALLVIGATAAGIAFKKRAKSSAKQRQAASLSKAEIQLQRDPGCTERLTPHDDVA